VERQTHQALERLHDLLFADQGIKSSCRGSVLTGEGSYLDCHRDDRQEMDVFRENQRMGVRPEWGSKFRFALAVSTSK
jgi:CHASE3 domain sensor protein